MSAGPSLPFSPFSSGSGVVHVSGTIGRDSGCGEMPQDVGEQTRCAMETIAQRLRAAGTDLSRVLRARVYLTDMADFPAMNAAYGPFFEETPPARSCVAVGALPDPAARVEIEVIAAAREGNDA